MDKEKGTITTKKKEITRKQFFQDTSKYALGAAVGVAGISLLTGNDAKANKTITSWPYPYTTLNLDVVRENAHHNYFAGYACCAGTFGALVQALSDAIGSPWTEFPIEMMIYGGGGVSGWGTLCGTLNGGAAMMNLVINGSITSLVNELYGYYTTEIFPTYAANAFTYADHNDLGILPQSISGSPLCHPSVSQWCFAANKSVSSDERKERCARLAGDIAVKTAELLNAYFGNTFTGTYTDPSTVSTCLACHGSSNVMTHMECAGCHDNDKSADHPTVEAVQSSATIGFQFDNAYPNPFQSSTSMKFSLMSKTKVRLEIYDIKGILVRSLIDSEVMNPGIYKATWDGTNNVGNTVVSGIYLGRLTTDDNMKSIRIDFVK